MQTWTVTLFLPGADSHLAGGSSSRSSPFSDLRRASSPTSLKPLRVRSLRTQSKQAWPPCDEHNREKKLNPWSKTSSRTGQQSQRDALSRDFAKHVSITGVRCT